MPIYIVYLPEVYIEQVRVEADSPEDAIARVGAGKGEPVENSWQPAGRLENKGDWTWLAELEE